MEHERPKNRARKVVQASSSGTGKKQRVPAEAQLKPVTAPPPPPPPPVEDATPATDVVAAKVGPKAPTPDAPPSFNSGSLIGANAGIAVNEEYSDDEKALNSFLRLHPMLSMEATSVRNLQLVAGMFDKSMLKADDLPIIPKSYDDRFLRPADERIGERPCLNEGACLCQIMAKVRFGAETSKAFTAVEFLLPTERESFLTGRGLPTRRNKCLVCIRYFMSYVYLLARNDPTFSIAQTGLSLQPFSNSLAVPPPSGQHDDVQAREAQEAGPRSSSPFCCKDGYLQAAMLFVDEKLLDTRAGRETSLGLLAWKPVVRYNSTDYKYIEDEAGPRIVQVGIGVGDATHGLQRNFQQPPQPTAAAVGAEGARA